MRKPFFITFFLFLLFQVSCSDLSEDPSSQDEPLEILETLLPRAQVQFTQTHGYHYAVFSALITQQVSGLHQQALRIDKYDISPTDTEAPWGNYYTDVLSILSSIKNTAEEADQKKYNAIAHIMMAHTIGLISDHWGDIPFSDSFLSDNGATYPSYDKQEDIYEHIFILLDEAEQLLIDGASFPYPGEEEDLFFQGDAQQWLQFINYLRLKYYLHLSQRKPHTDVTNLLDEPMFQQPGQSMKLNFQDFEFVHNPLYLYLTINPGSLRAGETLISLMKDDDPRLEVYFRKNDDEQYAGSAPGAADSNASLPGSFFTAPNAQITLASFTEQKFMKAEIHYNNGNEQEAGEALVDAIASSLQDYDVYDQQWLDETTTTLDINLKTIMEQKYIALFMQPQVWTDWRRTGFPGIEPSIGNFTQDRIPRRLPYAQSEFDLNPDNVITDLEIWDRVWWDVE